MDVLLVGADAKKVEPRERPLSDYDAVPDNSEGGLISDDHVSVKATVE